MSDHSRLLLNAFESDLLPPASREGRGTGTVNTVQFPCDTDLCGLFLLEGN